MRSEKKKQKRNFTKSCFFAERQVALLTFRQKATAVLAADC